MEIINLTYNLDKSYQCGLLQSHVNTQNERIEKSPRDSETETSLLMMPSHSNPTWQSEGGLELGAVNGGAILNLIDNVAGLAALRHCRTRVVTASIDRMDFLNPVHVGELLILKARVNYVGRTSMEIGVRVETEDLGTGNRKKRVMHS
ncbi:MAG: acyl-CoA thioesterase [Candidatus Kariarchaeaceae archaeon]|jgi:acyl-CoA hydrolase